MAHEIWRERDRESHGVGAGKRLTHINIEYIVIDFIIYVLKPESSKFKTRGTSYEIHDVNVQISVI
ncbi:hypothetical protein SESBI_11213 [Sesbania bispinosa]|nr:hypothetical protein SESBI_11213 [Sesbania bispinosa]